MKNKMVLRSVLLVITLNLLSISSLLAQENLTDLVLNVQDAVFVVLVDLPDGTAQGSGFFVSDDGIAVTNYHVLEGARSATVKTRNGKEYQIARILDYSKDMDLVKFQVKAGGHLRKLNLCDKLPRQGEAVVNLSNPLGLEQTLSTGIVSSVRIDPMHGMVVQTTAPISHGSSGSPLMNLEGEVVGICTFNQKDGQNLNFAVSSLQLKELSRNLDIELPQLGKSSLYTKGIREGERYEEDGDYEKAMKEYYSVISEDKENHLGYFKLAHLIRTNLMNILSERRLDALEFAFNCAGYCSLVEPSNLTYLNEFGIICTYIGILTRWQGAEAAELMNKAMNAFNSMLEINPNSIYAKYGIGKVICETLIRSDLANRIPLETRTPLIQVAKRFLEEVAFAYPGVDPLQYLYSIYVHVENDKGKALEIADLMVEYYPDQFVGYQCRADIKVFGFELFNEALYDIEKALMRTDDPRYRADILELRAPTYQGKANIERRNVAELYLKALEDLEEAYQLTKSEHYKLRKNEIAKSFKFTDEELRRP